MKKEEIKHRGKVLAVIFKGDFDKGLNFFTKDKDFIQAGTWNYDKGKETIPHSHKTVKRTANKTQEVIFIKKGAVEAKFFSDSGEFLKKKILEAGNIVIIFAGGHSFKILENNTQVLEVKNGPYPGLEKDKKTLKVK